MKPPKTEIFEMGNLAEDGEVIPFELSAKDMPNLMSHLTNIYSRPEDAVIREYGTNARDAHAEAGVDRPFEVFCPSALSPNFVVKDYGLGMSIEMVRNVFTKYGASTKRESDLFTGHLGLGCKAGMCYTSQITVKTIWQDEQGVRWKLVGIVSRKEDNTASFHVAYHEPTDEPTGTEIIVPRQKSYEFLDKVHWFYSFWKDGEVLIDGEPSKAMTGTRLGDNIVIQSIPRKSYRDYTDWVVMGGVPYALKTDHRLFNPKELGYDRAVSTTCWIKMGSVNHTPNREDLIYSDLTKGALRKLSLEVHGRIKWLLNKELENAADHWEALNVALKWQEEYGFRSKGLSYRGTQLPTKWKNPGLVHFSRSYYQSRATYEPVYQDTVSTKYILEHAQPANLTDKNGKADTRSIAIVGAPFGAARKDDRRAMGRHQETVPRTLTQGGKTRLRIYAEVNQRYRFFVMAELPDPVWFSGLETIPWSEVEKAKLPKEDTVAGYGFEDHTGVKVLVADLPSRGVLYCQPGQGHNLRPALKMLEQNRNQKYVLLQVHERRLAKFKKLVPYALPFGVVYTSELERLAIQAMSFPTIQRMVISHWDLQFLQELDKAGLVLDPEVEKWLKASRLPTDDKARDALLTFRNAYQQVVYRRDIKFTETSAIHRVLELQNVPIREIISKRYPLISKDHIPQNERASHLLEYMNWYYLKTHTNGNGNGNGSAPTPAEEAEA